MKVLKSVFDIILEGNEYRRFTFEFSNPYVFVTPFFAFRDGDRNYRQHGLIGYPCVFDIYVFRIEKPDKTEIFLVYQEDFWDTECDTYEYERILDEERDEVVTVVVENGNGGHISLFNRDELNNFLRSLDDEPEEEDE